jgi:predicted O-methyltransferase YrrM
MPFWKNMEYDAMMTVPEIIFLKEIVSGIPPDSIVFEIGTAVGGSATIMALANPNIKIYTVDLFSVNGESTDLINIEYKRVKDILSKYNNVEVLCGNARSDFNDWNTEIDLYFEDGTHFDPVLHDNLNRWSSFIKIGGLLLIHDHNEFCPDVEKNIQQLVKLNNFEMVKTVGSLTMLKKKEK